MENALVSYEEDIELHENHSLDSEVELLLEAEDVVFQYDPIDGNPGELLFGQSIVSVVRTLKAISFRLFALKDHLIRLY